MKKKQSGIRLVEGFELIIFHIKELIFPSKWIELKGEEAKLFRKCFERAISGK